jgi:hypothetical protein
VTTYADTLGEALESQLRQAASPIEREAFVA